MHIILNILHSSMMVTDDTCRWTINQSKLCFLLVIILSVTISKKTLYSSFCTWVRTHFLFTIYVMLYIDIRSCNYQTIYTISTTQELDWLHVIFYHFKKACDKDKDSTSNSYFLRNSFFLFSFCSCTYLMLVPHFTMLSSTNLDY